ncbi:hypothetical protein P3T97_11665 [Mammaliicoccus sciuri]|uniref:hypothetical protein n=1 Tax=Mammaliicoccus sciuri TaxID=1296 RepID=UPI002B25A8AA|nr:hypothetical protein [Mammaliicoccus sciuri]WQJ65417.1 hypothetical protein P3T97_11665 [Mammaliicoccus sciuri]
MKFSLEGILLKFENGDVINKYYIDDTLLAVGEQFKNGFKIKSTQKMLFLKYKAIIFNIVTSIVYLNKYHKFLSSEKNELNDYNKLINIQTCNSYLQSAYDNIYQLLNFMTYSENDNKVFYESDRKRFATEIDFRIKNIKRVSHNKDLIKMVNRYYESHMKELRFYNNYVKHNGHIEEYEDGTTSIYQVILDKKDISGSLEEGMKAAINGVNPIKSKAAKGYKVNLNEMSELLRNAIDELLRVLDVVMGSYVDEVYKELIRINNLS